ncbi:uncharacterized protein LOC125038595 [Penaeus chinensis]|uniref:uncharacterized protein LOC125038595 n=1 Tax=Penaeus chinensis TaxID=139456 RepID=UPI001FB7788E|nr:uncharacterized protein LOC125038595 [Penaeus chinensis]
MGQQDTERYRLIPVQGRGSEQRRVRMGSANDTVSALRLVIGNISSSDDDSLEQVGSPRTLQSGGSQILYKTAERYRHITPRSIYPSISSTRGTLALENNTPRPLQEGLEHPTWRSPQLGQSPLTGPLLPERGQVDLYQSGVGGTRESQGRSGEKEAVTPSGSNLAWWKGSLRNGQRLHNQSFSCENLTTSSSKFKSGSFNQQPPNSAEENIQFPEDVTFPDAAEADNFPEENLSENETLASIMREKFQGDGSIYDQSVAEVNMLLGRSLDLAHENEVRQNLSFISKYIYQGSQTGDSIDGKSSSEKGRKIENSRKSHKESLEKMLVNPELRRQSLKTLEERKQHNTTPSPHLSDTIADTTSDESNHQNSLVYKPDVDVQAASSLRIKESLATDTSKPSQKRVHRIHPPSRAEMATENLATGNYLPTMQSFERNSDDITEPSDAFPEVLTFPSRMKREVINFGVREEVEQMNKQQREQTGEDKHYSYEDSVNRRPRQGVHSTRGIEVPLVRHGRERLSIIRKKVTRNQTRSYHTFSPNKYYNIFIKNFPQIFKNYHTKLPNQHAHLPAKRIRQQVNKIIDSRGTDHTKKEAGKMSKPHTPHVARLVGRGEKAYGKSPQQRHARSRNRAKRKATTREVWALAGEDTLLPCDLGVRTPRDAVQMVMWLKEGSHTPLFSVDFREQERGSPQIWRDNSSSTARRALLYPAEEARQYRPTDTLLGRRINDFGETEEEEEGEEDTEGVMEDVGGLIVREVEVGDATVYRCRVDFLLTATRNARVNLTVVVPPTSVGVAWWLDEERGSNTGGEVGPFREGDSPTLICYTRDGVDNRSSQQLDLAWQTGIQHQKQDCQVLRIR